ncbi:MAG: DNA repair protein RecN [Candidatus Dormibacteria bacterium]
MSRLLELRLRSFALARDTRLDCDAGFGALSGETGAGKSLCIAAVRWALGGRAEGEAVGEGTSVRAVFEPSPESTALLASLGIPADDLVTLTRDAGSTGRSTCRVNGALVSQATLRELGDQLADVTAQGASHRMLQRSWQRRTLDDSGGAAVSEARAAMTEAHRRWRSAETVLGAARVASRRTASELAEAEATIAELDPLRLREGEEDELGAERLRLRHAAGIARAATLLADAASGDEAGAADVLERALVDVEALSGVDPGLADLGAEAASLTAALRDLGVSARRLADRVEVDPARLEAVEERLDALARVRRRHGSVRSALATLEAARRIGDAARGGQDVATLEAEARAAQAAAAESARRLSAARREAAHSLERAVERHLGALELPDARFRVTLAVTADAEGVDLGDGPVRCDADGVDQVELRLAANRGGVPLPLDEGPSGGELSRLALALAAAGGASGQPLLVLDEVDTGIGGETAARVGDLLAEIGRSRQVLAVTHRPEIASRAAWHLLVSRTGGGGPVASEVRRVEGDERIIEVARMMSGRTTEAALARAIELLQEGGATAARRRQAG